MADFVYAPPPALCVIYEDRDLCVIDKPGGLLSVPGSRPELQDSVELRARERHPHAWAVHRLDLDTSGLLVLATRRSAERALKAQFSQREVQKRYLAWVLGRPPARGLVDLPLLRVGGSPPVNRVCHEHGKPALTRFERLEERGGFSLLALTPETGRSHQLRVHLAAIGHPIVGDRFYAPPELQVVSSGLLLHAERLAFDHPYTGERLRFATPPPWTGRWAPCDPSSPGSCAFPSAAPRSR